MTDIICYKTYLSYIYLSSIHNLSTALRFCLSVNIGLFLLKDIIIHIFSSMKLNDLADS